MFFSNNQSLPSDKTTLSKVEMFNKSIQILEVAINQYLSQQTNLSKDEIKIKQAIFKSLRTNVQLVYMNSNENDTYNLDRIQKGLIPIIKEWGDKGLNESIDIFLKEMMDNSSKMKMTLKNHHSQN